MKISFENIKSAPNIESIVSPNMVKTLPNRYNLDKLVYPVHKIQPVLKINWPGHYILYCEPSKFNLLEILSSFMIRSIYDKQFINNENDRIKVPAFFRIAEHLTNDLMNGFNNPQLEHLSKSPVQWIHNLDGVNYGIQRVISNHILNLIMNNTKAIILTTTMEPNKWLAAFDRSLYTQMIRMKPLCVI